MRHATMSKGLSIRCMEYIVTFDPRAGDELKQRGFDHPRSGHGAGGDASPQPLQPGMSIGRYRIVERIARGGMGEVWLATAAGPGRFQKKFAIKTILPHLAERRDFVRMFIEEASLCAELSHPNLVQVFELGCSNGTYFIAMEFLSGCTVADLLRRVVTVRGRLVSPAVAANAVAQCCDGLQYAHDFRHPDGASREILHRDISPSNIMLRTTGSVAILDFGVAVARSNGRGPSERTLKGKYAYMAPERLNGGRVDRRSDVYSLGVVLYQLLTAARPHSAASDAELIRRIVEEVPPRASEKVPGLHPRIDEIAARAVAPDPAQRFQTAAEFGAALRDYLRSVGQPDGVHVLAQYLAAQFGDELRQPARRDDAASARGGAVRDKINGQSPGDEDYVEIIVDETPGETPQKAPDGDDMFTAHSRRLPRYGSFATGSSSRPATTASGRNPFVTTATPSAPSPRGHDGEPAFFGARLAPRKRDVRWPTAADATTPRRGSPRDRD